MSCIVDSCNGKVKCAGYCGKHYERLRKYGSVSDDAVKHQWGVRSVKKCRVEDCENKVVSGNICAKHYSRLRKYGTTSDSALHHQWGTGFIDKHGYRIVPHNGRQRPEHHVVMEPPAPLLGAGPSQERHPNRQ